MFHPHLFGDYIIVDRIAIGGMAEVFKARHRDAQRHQWVTLKRLLPHLGQDEKMVRMFQHEAEIASRVEHPNVIRVLDWGQVGDDHYLTQEHLLSVDMQSMLKHLSRRPTAFPTKLLLYVLEQLLLGLSACHRLTDRSASPLSVVHRDVTPENVLLGYDGRVMLTDFGIATSNLSHEGTQHGAPKGKTRYLSPEQALKQPLDGRSDLFSLGAVLYEAFQGKPFSMV